MEKIESTLSHEGSTRTLPAQYLRELALQAGIEAMKPYWSVINSQLESDRGSFHYSFASTLPKMEDDPTFNIKTYIESMLAERAGEVLAIELGGLGSALFSGFSEDFIKESRAISLVDNRSFFEEIDREADAERGHEVIAGDLLSSDTKQAVVAWLGDRKLDLIMERMRGGLAFLPDDPRVLLADLDFWYQRLAVGGLLFAEIPPALEPFLPNWVEHAQEQHLDISTSTMPHYDVDSHSRVSVIRLVKSQGSPKTFPFLPA